MDGDTELAARRTPLRSGQVSTAFARLLDGHGASPRLMRSVGEVTEDEPEDAPSHLQASGPLEGMLHRVTDRIGRWLLRDAHAKARRLLRELHERQDFSDILLRSMNEAVLVLDANHRVIEVNRRWEELTGYVAADAVGGQPPHPWEPVDSPDEHVLRRADGSTVPVVAAMSAVADPQGHPQAYVTTYWPVRAGGDDPGDLDRRREAAVRFQADLLSMLLSDIAQPVSSIAGLAELLTVDWTDLPDEDRFEIASKIDKNTRRLLAMSNDFRLLAELESGAAVPAPGPTPVAEVAAEVAATLSTRTVDCTVDIDPTIEALADRGHVYRILRDLLSNAVHHGAAPIVVQAHRAGDDVVLEVRDHGEGVPDELVPVLFDPVRGSGLGLTLVRRLAEANGGGVRYEPAHPHGTRMIVTLRAVGVPRLRHS